MYRLPNGKETEDPDEYGNAWLKYGRKLEKIFTGYKTAGVNPNIELILWGKNRFDKTFVEDRFTISVRAADILFAKVKK